MGGLGAVNPGVQGISGRGPTGCATALEDEVFEEEEFAEFEMDLARLCTLSATGGGGFKPAERGPGGGITATYCTPFEEPEN